MTVSNSKNELISRWRTVVSTLDQDPELTAHQKGFLSLAVPKALVDNALVLLAVRDEHTRRTIETRLLDPLTREFSKVLGFEVTFGFVVDPELDVPIRFEDLIGEPTPGTQIPIDPVTGNIVEGGIREQARQVMMNLGEVLKEAGCTYEQAVKTTCFLADMEDFAAFNEVYAEYFTGRPARSCVAVKTLPKDVLCEVEVIAALG